MLTESTVDLYQLICTTLEPVQPVAETSGHGTSAYLQSDDSLWLATPATHVYVDQDAGHCELTPTFVPGVASNESTAVDPASTAMDRTGSTLLAATRHNEERLVAGNSVDLSRHLVELQQSRLARSESRTTENCVSLDDFSGEPCRSLGDHQLTSLPSPPFPPAAGFGDCEFLVWPSTQPTRSDKERRRDARRLARPYWQERLRFQLTFKARALKNAVGFRAWQAKVACRRLLGLPIVRDW